VIEAFRRRSRSEAAAIKNSRGWKLRADRPTPTLFDASGPEFPALAGTQLEMLPIERLSCSHREQDNAA